MSVARIEWLSGPVLRAAADGPFALREAVEVGPDALLGEVVLLDGKRVEIQVYEDTSGLRLGTEVIGTGAPLSVRVGPGLLGGIFDGLLRPLTADVGFVRAGMRSRRDGSFEFRPTVEVGARLAAGTEFGTARAIGSKAGVMQPIGGELAADPVEKSAGRSQRCLLPPAMAGTVARIAPSGRYDEQAPVLWLRPDTVAGPAGAAVDDAEQEVALSHTWPVRLPRPFATRLASDRPLLTGQRVLDALFPVALGGKAAIPGGFGTGKTVLLEALAKGCDADVIIYLGCGERGNEMAGVLDEFPRLTDPRTGRPLMERTVIIANTSNMPVAAREASIYCGVTVAEYFRDQGLDVALMADSTSRWAEALREVSGRFGELPGEAGYPAYLSSRLADFYERAAVVETLSGELGSVTLMSAISPPSGDFSEPVTSHTKRYVKTFWALDVKRAQARFYPAIHPLQSYAEDAATFAPFWERAGNSQWLKLRSRLLALLDEQARLERMAKIIGKDALPARQQLTLLCAEVVNEAFLRQSAFSPVDRSASPARQAAMMRVVGRFMDLAERALGDGVHPERLRDIACFRPMMRMSEEIGEDRLDGFRELEARLERDFAALGGEDHAATAR